MTRAPDWLLKWLTERAGTNIVTICGTRDTDMNEDELRMALRWAVKRESDQRELHSRDMDHLHRLARGR